MTKTKIVLTLVALSVLALPVMALAANSNSAPEAPLNAIADMPTLITYIENALWMIFGLMAVICFVVAGILFLTAGGVPEKVQSARSAFIWGIAGVVVGIVAYSIIAIVSSVMGVGVQ